MYTKRATIISPRSLAHLHKVCSPRQNASDHFKIITLIRRNLGSANRLADFENGQNPRSQNYAGNGNDYASNGVAWNGIHNSGTSGQIIDVGASQGSSNSVYGESCGYSSFSAQTGQYNSYGGVDQKSNREFRRDSVGFNQNYDGVSVERLGNGSYSSSAGQSGNFSGYSGQNSGRFDQHRLDMNTSTNSPHEGRNVHGSYSSYVSVERREQSVIGGEGNRLIDGGFSNSGGQSGSFGGYSGLNTGGFDHPRLNTSTDTNNPREGNDNLRSSYGSSYLPRSVETGQQNRGGVDVERLGNRSFGGISQNRTGLENGNLQSWHSSNVAETMQQQKSPGVSNGKFQQSAGANYSAGYEQPQQSYWSSSNDFSNSPVTQISTHPEPEEISQPRDPLSELDGFCENGKAKEAVELLKSLEEQKIAVDLPRYMRLMQVCGEVEALEEAKAVHAEVLRSHPDLSVSVYNKILEMYSRCGSMEDATSVFRTMPGQNLTTWDTMITWLAKNGHGEEAIDLFTEFKRSGFKPDGHMFLGVFKACSAVGDVYEGLSHLKSMSRDFGIEPTVDHYEGVVEMLGSSGYLDEALEFVENMPLKPGVGVWETLMKLSRVHGNTELGDRCAELVEQIEPSRLSDQSKSGLVPVNPSDLAKEKAKKQARNPLEVRSRVHEYRAGDTSHPENDRIYANLRALREHMKEVGYVAETRFVLHDIDQESKEEALLSHSERLAVAYSLLSTSARSPVRIIKNLRACGDCHTALKIISKIVGRELIIRDAKRFHHFKDGSCSCRDYW